MREVRLKWVAANPVIKSAGSPTPFIALEDIESGTGRLLVDRPQLKESADGVTHTAGDVLFSKLRPYLAKSVLCTANGAATGELLVLRPQQELDSRFLYYVTLSQPWLDFANATSYGTKMPRTSWESLGEYRIPLPELDEQRNIADFLDAETARIDRVLSARLRQLDLLDRHYAAAARLLLSGNPVLTHSNVNGPEIPWLGRIPAKWTTTNIGRVSRTYMGTTFPHDYQGSRTGDLPFIKVADFSGADVGLSLDSASNWIDLDVARRLNARKVPRNSILYARVGAAMLLNQRRIVRRDCVVDDNVRGISFRQGVPRFWLHLLTLLDLGQLANPGPVPSVSETQVASVQIPLPPKNEQAAIAKELDEIQETVHKVKFTLRQQRETLVERRQSLITAAVFGQLQVTTARNIGS